MKQPSFGDKVRFVYLKASNEGSHPQPRIIKKGLIKGRAESGGFLIEIIGEEPGRHSQLGTICNRAEQDIIEVLK